MRMLIKTPPQNAQTLSRPTMDEDGRSDSGLAAASGCRLSTDSQRRARCALRFSLPMLAGAPLGADTRSDEGELKFALAADPQTQTIIINFGTPVQWFAMPRDDARKLATLILERLEELK